MTHVVTNNCIACKYTDCVEMCPVDCFHEGPNFLVIDPEECIDCGLCINECPVNAIKQAQDLQGNEKIFLDINAQLSHQWPVIRLQKNPLPEAEQFKNNSDKLALLKNQ
jgi:ferredoxin